MSNLIDPVGPRQVPDVDDTPAIVQVEACSCDSCLDSRARNLAALLEIGGATISDFWVMPVDDVTIGDDEEYGPPSEEDSTWWLEASRAVVPDDEFDRRWVEYEIWLDATGQMEDFEHEARAAMMDRYAGPSN
jgi:hypothetical protein